jgi:S-methylmethionine-dependent homocysteine/selenocysteine methylase
MGTDMNGSNAIYRNDLPQMQGEKFVTDGGLETVLVFQKQVELPLFAAFPLLSDDQGVATLRDYYQAYIDLALRNHTGLILDTATWRASRGWGEQLGYSAADLKRLIQRNVELLLELRDRHATADTPMVINGVIGPQDDGYNPSQLMSANEAKVYHQHQVDAFADSAADMVSAVTMTYVNEAVGITRAAKKAGIPITVSFTTETDGRLPDGTPLGDAITATDEATDSGPVYYMVNCAHPTHFSHVLNSEFAWTDRIYGIRANASRLSHAELDKAEELDDGDPQEFGEQYRELSTVLRNLRVVGGCCGTDHRHVAAASSALDAALPG